MDGEIPRQLSPDNGEYWTENFILIQDVAASQASRDTILFTAYVSTCYLDDYLRDLANIQRSQIVLYLYQAFHIAVIVIVFLISSEII